MCLFGCTVATSSVNDKSSRTLKDIQHMSGVCLVIMFKNFLLWIINSFEVTLHAYVSSHPKMQDYQTHIFSTN